jgi:tetratricopeptide (TPR) repeat protein
MLWLMVLLFIPVPGFSGSLEELSSKFGAYIKDHALKIAVMDFTSNNPEKNNDPIVVRERLTTLLDQKNITLIERSLIEKVLQEQKFQSSGEVSTDTVKKVGEITGADAIVSGTLTELANNQIEVNARIVQVTSGQVLSAGQAVVEKDWKYFKPVADSNDIKAIADSARDYYSRGVQFDADGKYSMALEFYSKAIEITPDFAEAYFGRGSAYLMKGQYDEAIADFDVVLKSKIDFMEAYFRRGTAYYKKEDYAKAITDLDRAVELSPETKTYRMRANAYDGIGDYDKAYADLVKAKDPHPESVYITAALLNSTVRHNYDESISLYTKLIALDPKNGVYYSGLGDCYFDKENYYQAVVEYNKAIELTPKVAEYYYGRGRAHGLAGDYPEAIADCTKAIHLLQNGAYNSGMCDNLPDSTMKNFFRGLSCEDFENNLRLNSLSDGYKLRGVTYYKQGLYSKAIADYSEGIKINANDKDLYTLRGAAYDAQGLYSKAIADYSEAIKINANDKDLYSLRGHVYSKVGLIEAANRDFDKYEAMSK